ncbi:MAG TPA: MFS transporter [Patescibacteria group bacterium]|nr:MFS transporter [Patescibacteria group bacterium]
MNKSQIALWALYDFAITILELNVALYFSEWLVIDNGVSELVYGSAIAVSILIALLILPVLGLLSDRDQRRLPYLYFFTFLGAATVILIGAFGLNIDRSPALVVISLLLFVIMNISYQGSLVFYNSILSSIAPKKSMGFVSGIGIAAGYVGAIIGGWIVSMFVNDSIPFLNISMPFIDNSSRIHAFIPSALLFLLFAAPALLFLQEPRLREPLKSRLQRMKAHVQQAPSYYQAVLEDIRRFGQYPSALRFLIAFFFFNNAIGTVMIFAPLYMENVFHLADVQKLPIMISALFAAAFGGLAGGWYADRRGNQRALSHVLVAWMVVLGIILFVSDSRVFGIVFAVGGIFFGATWAISRAYFITLIPETEQGKFFSFYSIFERFALIIGPIVWGSAVVLFAGFGTVKYQIALSSMIVLIVIGFVLLRRLHAPEMLTKTS